MYLSRKHKIIIVWNIRTGGVSLHRYLRLNVPDSDFGPDHAKYGPKKGHWNARLCQIVNYFEIPPETLPEYRIATFYRDPLDRCLSSMAYQEHHFPDRVEGLSFSEYLEIHGKYVHPQWMYLTDRDMDGIRVYDGIDLNWEWFNYHDYENEFKRIVSWFGLTTEGYGGPHEATTGIEIPHLNCFPRLQVEDITQQEIDRCKEIYRADYELLEQHGIMMPSRDL